MPWVLSLRFSGHIVPCIVDTTFWPIFGGGTNHRNSIRPPPKPLRLNRPHLHCCEPLQCNLSTASVNHNWRRLRMSQISQGCSRQPNRPPPPLFSNVAYSRMGPRESCKNADGSKFSTAVGSVYVGNSEPGSSRQQGVMHLQYSTSEKIELSRRHWYP